MLDAGLSFLVEEVFDDPVCLAGVVLGKCAVQLSPVLIDQLGERVAPLFNENR
jgi:hypothetical protein